MSKLDPCHVFSTSFIGSDTTVKRHFLEITEYKCAHCGRNEWQDVPLTLQLDHIDGNHNNNVFDNLRLLCPNCHSQTETYAGKQKWNDVIVSDKELIEALESCPNQTKALKKVGLDTGRSEYHARATFLINHYNVIVGSKKTTFGEFFDKN